MAVQRLASDDKMLGILFVAECPHQSAYVRRLFAQMAWFHSRQKGRIRGLILQNPFDER
jgi:hypothetical protein